jgi:hypothetical protein
VIQFGNNLSVPVRWILKKWAQSFFWVKYFRAKGKIFVFLCEEPKFGMKNLGKVAGKQLQRTRLENFFP